MLNEFKFDGVNFGISLPIYGGGWANDLEKIIQEKIDPSHYTRKNKFISLETSEIDFVIEKDNVHFTIEINKYDDISIILKDPPSEQNKIKVRAWANTITDAIKELRKS